MADFGRFVRTATTRSGGQSGVQFCLANTVGWRSRCTLTTLSHRRRERGRPSPADAPPFQPAGSAAASSLNSIALPPGADVLRHADLLDRRQ
ncbi:MAG: hypothetical protein DWI25_07130 [Planctomycetota bacterium]|nr:MAG: hypothetical protein DWI25_07130 [Planctomycetota bacterium]